MAQRLVPQVTGGGKVRHRLVQLHYERDYVLQGGRALLSGVGELRCVTSAALKHCQLRPQLVWLAL